MPTMQCRTSAPRRPPGGTRFGGTKCRFALRCDCTAPAAVRDVLRDLDGIGWILGDAMLVASELVSNAVMHSGAGERDLLRVELRRADDVLVISVTDPGASGDAARVRPEPDPFGGLGLRLVEQLSHRWGSERRDGHRVWAELALPAEA